MTEEIWNPDNDLDHDDKHDSMANLETENIEVPASPEMEPNRAIDASQIEHPYISGLPAPVSKKKAPKKLMAVAGLCLVSALIGGVAATVISPRLYPNTSSSVPAISSPLTPVAYAGADQANFPVVQIAKTVGPAVVGVANYQSVSSFFGGSAGSQLAASGSGFIIDAQKGYIVTNNHVIDGAKKITVSLSDKRSLDAKLVGADPNTDLAVLQISDTKNLTAVSLGDSSTIQVGEPVVAIGNPGGEEFARSVTTGVVSAVNRTLDLQGESGFNLIQTDAAINPGNSGGPLVDYQGRVIGINSAKYAEQGFEGMGFSIPISNALPIIKELIKSGVATHPALLVSINDQYDSYAQSNNLPLGAYIAGVSPGGPAAQAGLSKGDVITAINGSTVQNSLDLVHELYKYQVGDKVTVTYLRNGRTNKGQVTLGAINSSQK